MAGPRPPEPPDAAERRSRPPTIVYPATVLRPPDLAMLNAARQGLTMIGEAVAPPRDACAFRVPKGHFFRIVSTEGPQVGDLNL